MFHISPTKKKKPKKTKTNKSRCLSYIGSASASRFGNFGELTPHSEKILGTFNNKQFAYINLNLLYMKHNKDNCINVYIYMHIYKYIWYIDIYIDIIALYKNKTIH